MVSRYEQLNLASVEVGLRGVGDLFQVHFVVDYTRDLHKTVLVICCRLLVWGGTAT